MSAKDILENDGSNVRQTKEAYDAMASDFEQLREDLRALRKDVASLTSAGVKDASHALKDKAEKVENRARDSMESAATEFQEMQKQAEKAVRKNPLTAVAGALAIGYFLAGLRK